MSQGDPNYPSSYENPAVVPSPRPDTVPPVSTRTPSTQATTPAANRGGGGGGNSADSLIDNVKNYVLSIYGALKIVQFVSKLTSNICFDFKIVLFHSSPQNFFST